MKIAFYVTFLFLLMFLIPVFSYEGIDYIKQGNSYNYSCQNSINLDVDNSNLEVYSDDYKPYLVKELPFVINLTIKTNNNVSYLKNYILGDLSFRYFVLCDGKMLINWNGYASARITSDNKIEFATSENGLTNESYCYIFGRIYAANETQECGFGYVTGTSQDYRLQERVWDENNLLFKIQTDTQRSLLNSQESYQNQSIQINTLQAQIAAYNFAFYLFVAVFTIISILSTMFYYSDVSRQSRKQNELISLQNKLQNVNFQLKKSFTPKISCKFVKFKKLGIIPYYKLAIINRGFGLAQNIQLGKITEEGTKKILARIYSNIRIDYLLATQHIYLEGFWFKHEIKKFKNPTMEIEYENIKCHKTKTKFKIEIDN